MIVSRSSEFRYAHGPQTLVIRRDRGGDGFVVAVGTRRRFAEDTLNGERLAEFRAWLAGAIESFGGRRQLSGGLGGSLTLVRGRSNGSKPMALAVTMTASARSAALEWLS